MNWLVCIIFHQLFGNNPVQEPAHGIALGRWHLFRFSRCSTDMQEKPEAKLRDIARRAGGRRESRRGICAVPRTRRLQLFLHIYTLTQQSAYLNCSQFDDVNISALLSSFQVGYDKRVRPNYGGKCVKEKLTDAFPMMKVDFSQITCLPDNMTPLGMGEWQHHWWESICGKNAFVWN